jgi:hypothetical protein
MHNFHSHSVHYLNELNASKASDESSGGDNSRNNIATNNLGAESSFQFDVVHDSTERRPVVNAINVEISIIILRVGTNTKIIITTIK